MKRRTKNASIETYGWWAVAASALALIILYSCGVIGPPKLPACNSPTAERMVMNTFNEHPLSQIYKIQIVRLRNQFTDVNTSEARHCKATAVTNQGYNEIAYTLYWVGDERTNYEVRLEEVNRTLNYGSFRNSLRRQFGGN